MKKFLSVMLILSLVFTMFSFVSADEKESVIIEKNKKTIVTEITEDEYIKIVSKHSGLSEDIIKKKIKEYKEKVGKETIPTEDGTDVSITSISYMRAITEEDFSEGASISTPVELGMAYTVYYSGSFRQINSIDSIWTGASGTGLYTWSEFSKYSYPSTFPSTTAEAHARGAVETQINMSVSGSAEIKQQLIGCGFTVSAEIGTTLYMRKVGDLNLYVNLYY